MSQAHGLLASLGRPAPGLSYPELLRSADDPRWLGAVRGLAGAALGVLTMLVVLPLLQAALMGLGWVLSGSPGAYADWYAQARAFELPQGMLAAHLALASLIGLSLALVAVVHHLRPRWLHSVRPGFRWRYAALALVVAAVVLGALVAGQHLGQPVEFHPQDGFWWFLPVILLTSPLQAAGEEYFFRGYLLQALNLMAPGRWFGILASALVFAAFHGTQNLPLFLDRFGFGLLAGVLAVGTGGLEAGIAAHVVNNLIAFCYAGLTGTIAQARATQELGWVDAAWDLAGFAVFTLAALLLARRLRLETRTPV